MCGMCPDVIDGCYDEACILRREDGTRLNHYVAWKLVGDPYCEHLAEKHGHPNALWSDKYGCDGDEWCDAPEGRHEPDCPALNGGSTPNPTEATDGNANTEQRGETP